MPSKKRGLDTEAMLNSLTAEKFKMDAEAKIKVESNENNKSDKITSKPVEVKKETEKKVKRNNTNKNFEAFEAALVKATDDDIDWQYMCFMKQLPTTLPEETRQKWIRKVRRLLKIA